MISFISIFCTFGVPLALAKTRSLAALNFDATFNSLSFLRVAASTGIDLLPLLVLVSPIDNVPCFTAPSTLISSLSKSMLPHFKARSSPCLIPLARAVSTIHLSNNVSPGKPSLTIFWISLGCILGALSEILDDIPRVILSIGLINIQPLRTQ